MKLMIIIPTLFGRGAEKVASDISCNLPDTVTQTFVLFSEHIVFPARGDIVFLDRHGYSEGIHRKAVTLFRRVKSLRGLIKEKKPDVVLSFMERANILAIITKCVLPKNSHRTITSTHMVPSKHVELQSGIYGFVYRLLIRLLYNRSDCIIAVSRAVADDLIAIYHVNQKKLAVVPNPVNREKINSLAAENVDHPWFSEEIPIIINVAALSEEKNHKGLLDAFRLARLKVNCRLVLVGGGKLEDDLPLYAQSLGIGDSVLFLGFQENPFRFVKRAALFVLSSNYEALSVALLEALALGCPVITTNCGGSREIIVAGKTSYPEVTGLYEADYGILVPVGDTQCLAKAMVLLLNNHRLRDHYGKKALERAQDFSVDKVIAHYLRLFAKRPANTTI